MGVWKLGNVVKSAIQAHARYYAEKHMHLAANQCPLTARTIERAFNTPEAIDAVNAARAKGYNVGPHYTHVNLLLSKDDVPGVIRDAMLVFNFDPGILSQVDLSGYNYGVDCDGRMDVAKATAKKYLTPLNTSNMDDADIAALAKWVNAFVRARRMNIMVENTVTYVLARTQTTAELHATWPLLTTLLDGPQAATILGKHRSRFMNYMRSPPRDLTNYAPSTSLIETWGQCMRACETVIHQGMMLTIEDKFQKRDGMSGVSLHAWSPLSNDPSFTSKVHT
jgi:hypothetical protein